MAQRDKVWHAALTYLIEHEELRLRDLDIDVDRHTTRRTLATMAELGWLSHKEDSPIWRRGHRLECLLQQYDTDGDKEDDT